MNHCRLVQLQVGLENALHLCRQGRQRIRQHGPKTVARKLQELVQQLVHLFGGGGYERARTWASVTPVDFPTLSASASIGKQTFVAAVLLGHQDGSRREERAEVVLRNGLCRHVLGKKAEAAHHRHILLKVLLQRQGSKQRR